MPCDTVRAASVYAEVQIMDERRGEGREMQEVTWERCVGRSVFDEL